MNRYLLWSDIFTMVTYVPNPSPRSEHLHILKMLVYDCFCFEWMEHLGLQIKIMNCICIMFLPFLIFPMIFNEVIWSPKLQIPHMILVSKSCLLVFIKIRCVFSITGRWLVVRYGIQNFCESNVWKSFILLLLLLLLRCSLQRYFGRAVGMSENPRGASSNVVGITCLPGWNSVN